jgi:O-antigen/teichoic acid export membrane protein
MNDRALSAEPRPPSDRSRAGARRSARHSARRGVVEIVVGSALGLGLLVAISPVLSRLYDPADFAVLQLFTGVVSVGAVLATLRLELAIPLARDDRETRTVLHAGVLGSIVVAVLCWLLGQLAAPWWAVGQTLLDLRSVWWLVPVTVLAIAWFQLVSAVLVRAERYRLLAGRNTAQGVGTAVVQLGFGAAGAGAIGLLLGVAAGRLSGLLLVTRRGMPGRAAGTRSRVRLRDQLAAVSRFRRFPLITTWSALLNNAGQYAPYLVFALTFGPTATGWLAFTTRLLGLPVNAVGQAVAQVFLGRGARAGRTATGELPRLTWLAVRRLSLLGAGPALLVVVAAPWVFGWLFGAAWGPAGWYAQILAPAFFLQFVANPVSHVFNLVGRQALALGWEVVRFALVVGAPLLAWWAGGSDLVGVLAYAGSVAVSYAGVLALVWWVLRRA